MPITIIPASHVPKAPLPNPCAKSADELLKLSCPDVYVPNETRIIASSFDSVDTYSNIHPSAASLVRGAIEAWGSHQHLVLRPEEFWFTVLVQLNFYMASNAEKVRDKFVAHKGRKIIHVERDDWESIIAGFKGELHKKVKTEWLANWIIPDFSTSTRHDEMTATVLMMGLMKHYFTYSGGIVCGIPSITILGEKEDWEKLLSRLDRLPEFGEECEKYAARLRPLFTRMVATFEQPQAQATKDFWDQFVQAKVVHSFDCDTPPKVYIITGWIVGLFYWNAKGAVQFNPGWVRSEYGVDLLTYDGVQYGMVSLDSIPAGYAKAPFEMTTESGQSLEGYLLAGSIGKRMTTEAPKGYLTQANQAQANQAQANQAQVNQAQVNQAPVTAAPPTLDEDSEPEEHEGCGGRLSNFFCFGKKPKSKKASQSLEENAEVKDQRLEEAEVSDQRLEEKAEASKKPAALAEESHGTIQPMSGWFLFGPDKPVGPRYDDTEKERLKQALEGCEGVPHIHA